ncbi:galactose mutarotase [Sphingobacterium sp. SGG-5]|uniref:aldose epimerase family protein n=1 Tax=Sphingobacterium sp. SGG-5 TaxID=2710881 RepID=UPI0013EA4FA6|nr:aldose epimerase family protein [Sphingobacterium sp. SGG-5]NGM61542.1 galactose mutarotase [Sphingobacterium sp. SGG-5]
MNKQSKLSIFILMAMLVGSCQQGTNKNKEEIQEAISLPDAVEFRDTIKGEEISLFTLKNKRGMEVALTNFGARIVSLIVSDKDGVNRDVVLGFNKAEDYNNPEEPYFGPIVGPFGNRIANGKFSLDGVEYTLPQNNGPNTLHGGLEGLHFVVWQAKQLSDEAVEFTCVLPDGKEGFPGDRAFKVMYSVNDNNELTIAYEAKTDKRTVLNLTNHAYFNLNGEGSGTILNHQLQIFADQITPVNETLIPTGELKGVKETAFDFTALKAIGKDIEQDDEQLTFGKGYDHNFVLNETKHDGYNYACRLIGDQSGIVMDIYTAEPGIQFYSGNFMADKVTLKNGATDSFRTGLCLEPQHFPDSPNQPSFPSTEVNPGEVYKTTSVYKFSVQ